MITTVDFEIDGIAIEEGESLEDIKARLKPKKRAISGDLLDTANTYDDKVALLRMLVNEDSARVANVLKSSNVWDNEGLRYAIDEDLSKLRYLDNSDLENKRKEMKTTEKGNCVE